jgi:hypothetical protein
MEMFEGRLSWAEIRGKQRISAEIGEMPKSMRKVYRFIRRSEFDEEPNYRLLMAFWSGRMLEESVGMREFGVE